MSQSREAHVFWSPHSDDETIAMGGSIARAILAGHRVTVALVTDNRPSERGISVFPDVTRDLTYARRDEWFDALHALRVVDFVAFGIPEQLMCIDRRAAEAVLVEQMEHMHRRFEGAHVTHHAVMGDHDPHADAGQTSLAHRVCERAARTFARLHTEATVLLHAVYIYSHPIERRTAPIIETLTDAEMAAKRRAIDAYKPSATSIGYGYRSVPELFDAAESDPHEYVDRLPGGPWSGGPA